MELPSQFMEKWCYHRETWIGLSEHIETKEKQVRPNYTDEALTKEVEGKVILEVIILAEGKIGPVRILRGLSAGLTENAIECVHQWVFVPGKLKGQPVDVIAEIEVDFSILEKPK